MHKLRCRDYEQTMMKTEHDCEKLLDESVKIHGHLCPGQVLGVRMALLGFQKIGTGGSNPDELVKNVSDPDSGLQSYNQNMVKVYKA